MIHLVLAAHSDIPLRRFQGEDHLEQCQCAEVSLFDSSWAALLRNAAHISDNSVDQIGDPQIPIGLWLALQRRICVP